MAGSNVYYPQPRDPSIQVVMDPDVPFDPDRRSWRMGVFNPDGTPASLGTGGTGTKGDPGDSAFDIWLAQPGNEGKTVDDYLASLIGPKGDKGDKGDTGNTGDTGPPGPNPAIYTVATQPAANSVPNLTLIVIADLNGGTIFQAQSGAWVKIAAGVLETGGRELGLAEITATSAVITNTTTPQIITGLSKTVTVGARPVVAEFTGQIANAGTATQATTLAIFRDGSQIDAIPVFLPATQFGGHSLTFTTRDAPSAGDHTYDVRLKAGIAAGAYVQMASPAPAKAHLHIREC